MDRGNRPPASRRTLLVAVGTLLLGFAWGFLVHRSKSFPYALIRSAARAAGIGTAGTATPAPAHFEVHSRSSAAAALLDLPYADGQIDKRAGLRNVIVHRPGTSPGLDLYSTTSDGRAFLMDARSRSRPMGRPCGASPIPRSTAGASARRSIGWSAFPRRLFLSSRKPPGRHEDPRAPHSPRSSAGRGSTSPVSRRDGSAGLAAAGSPRREHAWIARPNEEK